MINKIKEKAKHFKSELKDRTITAMVTAFALVIALSWQDVIKTITDTLLSAITPTSLSTLIKYTVLYKSVSALLLTAVCVIGIVVITKREEK